MLYVDELTGGFVEQLYEDALAEDYWGRLNEAMWAPLQVAFDMALEKGWEPNQMMMVHRADNSRSLQLGGVVDVDGVWRNGVIVVEVSWSYDVHVHDEPKLVVTEKWNDSVPWAPRK